MKHKIVLLLLLLFIVGDLPCQSEHELLLKRSIAYRKANQTDSAIILNGVLIHSLEESHTQDSLLGEAYRNNGIAWKSLSMDSSKYYFIKAKNIATKLKDTALLVSILNNEALMLKSQDINQSDSVYQIILSKYKSALSPKKHITILLNRVNNQLEKSQYQEAISSCQQAIEISKKSGYNEMDPLIFSQMGNIYFHLGDYHKSIENYSLCLKAGKSIQLNHRIAAYNSLASCYVKLDSFDKAIQFIDSVLYNNPQEKSRFISLYNKCSVYLKMGEIKKAETILADLKGADPDVQCYMDILALEIELKKGNTEAFNKKFSATYHCLTKFGTNKQLFEFLDQILLARLKGQDSLYYVEKSRLEKLIHNDATDAILRKVDIQHSIKNEEIKNNALSIQNQLQAAQLKAQRAYMLGGGGILLLLGLLASLFYGQRKKQEKYNKTLKVQNQKIDMLKREAIHRTNNHLALATNLIAMQKQLAAEKGAKEVIEDSERKLRAIAAANKRLSGNYENVNNLQEIIDETVRDIIFSTANFKANFESKIDPVSMDKAHYSLVALIVNELTVNSIKHAFHKQPHAEIRITGKKGGGFFHLTYSDNGHFQNSGHDSEGFELIMGLADQMDGKTKASTSNGFTFVLSIPIHEE